MKYTSIHELTDGLVVEITAIPKLLDLLTLEGCILTIDAMGCQKAVAEKIISKKADHILIVKDNQSGLKKKIHKTFDRKEGLKSPENMDSGHGRVETRRCDVTSCLNFLDGKEDWKNLRSIVRVCSERYNKKTGEFSTERRFYITSLPDNPALFNASIRSHWGD